MTLSERPRRCGVGTAFPRMPSLLLKMVEEITSLFALTEKAPRSSGRRSISGITRLERMSRSPIRWSRYETQQRSSLRSRVQEGLSDAVRCQRLHDDTTRDSFTKHGDSTPTGDGVLSELP